jgi:putative oxidoreductase
MVGLTYAMAGYRDLTSPDSPDKGHGMPKGFMTFISIAEIAGAAGLILGVLQQLAAIGLIIIMLGAIQKKIFDWKTGFYGNGSGWYYDTTLVSMLVVILFTDGGRFVLLH